MSFENRAIEALKQSNSWITRQRWFGDKARPAIGSEPEFFRVVELGERVGALAIVRFSFEWGADARYFVPLVSLAEGVTSQAGEGLADALGDTEFLRWFVDGFQNDRTMDGNESSWLWRRIGDDFPAPDIVDYDHVRAISGEQSNTSIVFDRKFIGKVFRRVQPGLNPDLEIGEFLSTDNRFRHAPRLYGLVEMKHGDEAIALAAIQEFVPNHADGWTWFLGELRGLTEDSLEAAVDAVRLLARRTGELHVALASNPDDASFAPEPFEAVDAQMLIGRVIAEIEESVEGLVRYLPPAEIEQLHKSMGRMMGDAHSLIGTHKIRVHGDYHLGQTLRTLDDDFMLIDFEGEPSRTMEQRRMKLPGLKDVAGMVRSLDYAAATLLQDETDSGRRLLVQRWLQESTVAFIDTYRDVVRESSVPIAPMSDVVFTDALNLMIAEKALYEVRYELNNRPDWLTIPLNALRRLAGMDVPAGAE
jgi:maltokinase